ncbi:hypothetical protein EYF80_044653 [Liparis tanakae]|uniref:Uncharacterized protein n=1 Tax=Liparis tanakae TaxID=230148 RepID=A0A4Z2FV67_9TELE|nr:hypothetical protein EYF80_044653 [Liparis tanakae]
MTSQCSSSAFPSKKSTGSEGTTISAPFTGSAGQTQQHTEILVAGSITPFAVIPRLLWAKLGQNEGSPTVGQGAAVPDGGNMGVHVCLRGKAGVVQEPRDVRESASADMAAELGSRQYGVSTVEIFNFHFHIASDWNWRKKGGGGLTTERFIESERLARQLLHLSLHPTSSNGHVLPGYHCDGEPGNKGLSNCGRCHFFVIH